MSLDLLGPGSVPNSTTVEPTDTVSFGATDTWFQDCPAGTTTGGTFMSALWFNRVLQQIRNVIRGMGITGASLSNANPNMLLTAVQLAGKNPPYGVDSSTTPGTIIVTLSPAPQVAFGAGDHILVKIAQPCIAGGTTITANGFGPYNVTHNDASALVANDYVVGQVLDLKFDGTEFQMGRSVQAAAGSVTAAMLAAGAAALGYVGVQTADNLHLSNDGTNATRDINVSVGRVRDDSDVTNLVLAGAMAKRLDTAWAAGGAVGATSQGGCDTGTKGNSQTWHTYLIGKPGMSVTNYARAANVASLTIAGHGLGVGGTIRVVGVGNGFDGAAVITAVTTNTVSYNNGGANVGTTSCTATADGFDVLASQSYPVPTMPSGWTAKQCLGSFVTNGSGAIIAMTQIGDRFMFTAPITDYGSTPSPPISITTSLPKGLSVFGQFLMQVSSANPQTNGRLYSTWQADAAVPYSLNIYSNGAPNTTINGSVEAATDTSANVRYDCSGSFTLTLYTLGWRDPRRRMF